MDEFNYRGELVVIGSLVAERASRQYDEHWAQALAATPDNVFGDLAHQRHVRIEPGANDGVYRTHIGRHEIIDKGNQMGTLSNTAGTRVGVRKLRLGLRGQLIHFTML